MAFCNSCGASLETGTRFCNKCGAAQGTAAPAASAPVAAAPVAAQAAPPKQGSSAVKIILIIVAVIVGLGIIGIGAISYIGYRVAKSAHVTNKNGEVSIDSPFGKMETNSDPAEAAKNLGVDLYPGAEVQKNGSVNMTIMGMHTATAVLQTSDAPSQVADFYKSKMPNANATSQGDMYQFSMGDKTNLTTVTIQGMGGTTKIQITRVNKVST